MLFVNVKDRRVDVDAIMRLAHCCDPSLCGRSGSCCGVYDVWIDADDESRLKENVAAASFFIDGGEPAKAFNDYMRRIGPGHVLVKNEEGLCALAYETADGSVCCSLHSAALKQNRAPKALKPAGCLIWPLCTYGPNKSIISVQDGAYKYPCNRRRQPGNRDLDPGTADLIRENFGQVFLDDFLRELGLLFRRGLR